MNLYQRNNMNIFQHKAGSIKPMRNLADNFLNEDMSKIAKVTEHTEQQFQEVKDAMKSLGYPETKHIELETIDQVRSKVIYDGHLTIGIYDFDRHTFVD